MILMSPRALLPAVLAALVVSSLLHPAPPTATPPLIASPPPAAPMAAMAATRPLKPQPKTDKRIAFSFDDVPRQRGAFLEKGERPQRLLEALKTAGIEQAVFFINPGRISASDDDAATIAAYARAGHLIANHSANHGDLSAMSADKYLADIDRAEKWLKGRQNYRPWFRFPFLNEGGKNRSKRDAVRAGLKQRGLINGYVTVDASDWKLDNLTIAAAKEGKTMDWNGLRDLFVESYLQSADFSDELARRTLHRAPVQMILLHETDLAAIFLDDLAQALKDDGWTIVSADEAYRDPIAYREPDVAFADGTRLQMLAAEKGIGKRWYRRNDPKLVKKLFAERVLHE